MLFILLIILSVIAGYSLDCREGPMKKNSLSVCLFVGLCQGQRQGGKSGSRDRGIVCIPVSPTDPAYRQWILCILCIATRSSVSYVSPMDPPYPR